MQLETIINSTWIVAVIIIAICVITYVIKKGKVSLYDAALYLVTVAEDEWGSDTGKIKFAQVLTTIKKMYPFTSFFLKEKELADIIEAALDEMKRIIAAKKAKEEKLLKEKMEQEMANLKMEQTTAEEQESQE